MRYSVGSGLGQDAIPDPSANAAAWLRLCPGKRWPRHAGATGLARAQEHPAHGALHRAVAASVQGFLALLKQAIPNYISSPNRPPQPSEFRSACSGSPSSRTATLVEVSLWLKGASNR